jgi:hypothetical protein
VRGHACARRFITHDGVGGKSWSVNSVRTELAEAVETLSGQSSAVRPGHSVRTEVGGNASQGPLGRVSQRPAATTSTPTPCARVVLDHKMLRIVV